MRLGFVSRALSSEIISIEECPISLPEIVAALDRLKALAELVCATTKSFRVTVTVTGSGLDVAVHESGKLGENQRRIASNFVIAEGLARLSVDGEIIVEPKKPVVLFGGVAVAVPPGAFLEAPSCLPNRRWPTSSAGIWRVPGRLPISLPVAAVLRCALRRNRKCSR